MNQKKKMKVCKKLFNKKMNTFKSKMRILIIIKSNINKFC